MSTTFSLRLVGSEAKKPSSVRRCLFGKCENLDNTLTFQENLFAQENSKRLRELYGFDPVLGKPVEGGQFECTAVDPKSLPSFYSKGYLKHRTSAFRLKERSRSPVNTCSLLNSDILRFNPVRSVKRRLPLDNDYSSNIVNDENKETVIPASSSNSRLQMPVESIPVVTGLSPLSPTSSDSSSDSYPSPLSLMELHHRTPKQTTQTSVKDFFPMHKRQRCSPKSTES